jgi:hypothetical protein
MTTSVGMKFSLKQLRAALKETLRPARQSPGIRIGLYGDLHRAGVEVVRLATVVVF